jgi:Asp-tRNA(Asn)/Glu-tRNA(Gln) amidotransferase A subunit family amidase
MIGTYVLSSGYYDAYYLRAQKVRTKILNDFVDAFESCDAILTPTCPSQPLRLAKRVAIRWKCTSTTCSR